MTKSNLRQNALSGSYFQGIVHHCGNSESELKAGAQTETEAETTDLAVRYTSGLSGDYASIYLSDIPQNQPPRDGIAHCGLGHPPSINNQGNASWTWPATKLIWTSH